MKVLVAPLNWGLGHATRSMALVRRYLAQGDEVVLAGDGDSLALMKKTFPALRAIPLPHLDIRYSSGKSQVEAMLKNLPRLIRWARADHKALCDILSLERFDLIISDNRFGFYVEKPLTQPLPQGEGGISGQPSAVRCIYITHQVFPRLPKGWHWLEPLAARLHRRIISHYDELWIPDYQDLSSSLAGELSHGASSGQESTISALATRCKYIGPLSRFEGMKVEPDTTYDIVAVLSGPEPQRTLFEQQLLSEVRNQEPGIRNQLSADSKVLIVRGKPAAPATTIRKGNIVFVNHLSDERLASYLLGCKQVICRSGYTSIMDLAALGILAKADLRPTPGQPEQEYLFQWLNS